MQKLLTGHNSSNLSNLFLHNKILNEQSAENLIVIGATTKQEKMGKGIDPPSVCKTHVFWIQIGTQIQGFPPCVAPKENEVLYGFMVQYHISSSTRSTAPGLEF
jgi:hypothetical protein